MARYFQLLDADAPQDIMRFPFGLFPETMEKGETIEDALNKVKKQLPKNAVILHTEEYAPQEERVITIDAFTDNEAFHKAMRL